jgi:fused signal recognition particle receptor
VFGLLKKKISGFVEKISGKKEEEIGPGEEKKEIPGKGGKAPPKKETAVPVPEKKESKKKPEKEKKPGHAPEPAKETPPEKKDGKKEPVPAKEEPKKKDDAKEPKPKKEEAKPAEKPKEKEKAEPAKETPPEKKKGFLNRILGKKEETAKTAQPGEAAKKEKTPLEPKEEGEKKPEPEKDGRAREKEETLKKKVKKGFLASVSETIRGESEIREEEVEELLDELELGMLESDVALSVAEEIKGELRKRIVGAKVKRGQTAPFVKESLKEILLNMFGETPGFEFSERFSGAEKPYRIMVVGPNGAGKTTTIAKIVKLLQNEGHSVCVAASDTFRAAAVEQLIHHGEKLGVKVIHGAYGSDPTSIAFDAVNYAKSNGLGVVIIDTAGRQETNINLLNQLKKMDRVIKPDMKIYVGESIAGNAMVEQISRFNADIGLDGVILTKLDCDAKGGTVISVSKVAHLPILYVGVGQGYGDMKKFIAADIVEEILS